MASSTINFLLSSTFTIFTSLARLPHLSRPVGAAERSWLTRPARVGRMDDCGSEYRGYGGYATSFLGTYSNSSSSRDNSPHDHHAVEARSRLEQKCCGATWKNLCLQRWETDGGRSTKLNAIHSHYEAMCLIIVSLKNGQLTKGQM